MSRLSNFARCNCAPVYYIFQLMLCFSGVFYMSKSAVDNISTRSDSDQARLAPIAGPLIDSEGFKRLHLTTFLGGLSPKFAHLVDAPVSFTDIADGSRGDHSIGVAALILDICNCLSLSQESCRYGVAWGLVHDIATWPLSHTGEAAFNKNSNVDAKTLRMQMIEGSKNCRQACT